MNTPGDTDLLREVRTLRLALNITLVSLVILSGSIGIYLFRQVSLLRRQVEQTSRVAIQMTRTYNENVASQAKEFERQLVEFAATRPELKQQLAKYFQHASNAAPAAGEAPKP